MLKNMLLGSHFTGLMCDVFTPQVISIFQRRTSILLFLFISLLAASGCGLLGVKQKVNVPPLLTPIAEADTAQLFAEINRLATIRSIRGKIDIQFLDTSFAECGIAEKYRTADGTVVLQRPGQIFLSIQVPFVGKDIAQMTSDGERFRVAVLMGEEKHRRFLRGTNKAVYPRMKSDELKPGCGDDGKNRTMNEKRAVSALSGLRPQHFTDALLIRPVAQAEDAGLIYVRSESFEEQQDPRPRAKKGARVIRAYYLLDELVPEGEGRARLLRRFWFDRFGAIRLARLQTFDERGKLATDVLFEDPKNFGGEGQHVLPARIVLTRPQDNYSLRVSYQAPESVVVNRSYEDELFLLENKSQLPEVDLDKLETQRKAQQK